MTMELKTIPVTVKTTDALALREAMRRVGYAVEDTGERIMTEDGADAEAVLTLRVPEEACLTDAERIHALIRA